MAAFLNLRLLNTGLELSRQASNAATAAANVANDSLVIENRPWLFFERSDFRALENSGIIETLSVRNDGKTPAMNLDACIVFEVHPINEHPRFDYIPDGRGPACFKTTIRTLGPGQRYPISLRVLQRASGGKPVIPDRKFLLDLQAGASCAVTHARFTYQDVFGISRWSQICDFIYYGDATKRVAALETCALYHGMDNYTRKDQSGKQP